MGRKKIPFESIDIALASRLTGIGLTMAQVADVLGVSKDTLERRAKESDELRLAISSGRSKAAAAVCETAFNMATSGIHPAMTMFWLKTRQGWREKGNDPGIENVAKKTVYSTLFKLALTPGL